MPTQQELFQQELLKLSIDVTDKDILSARETFGYSRTSIYDYLHGTGKNNDTSFALIKFFRKQIADRNKILQP